MHLNWIIISYLGNDGFSMFIENRIYEHVLLPILEFHLLLFLQISFKRLEDLILGLAVNSGILHKSLSSRDGLFDYRAH